jgi:hypothetical protein
LTILSSGLSPWRILPILKCPCAKLARSPRLKIYNQIGAPARKSSVRITGFCSEINIERIRGIFPPFRLPLSAFLLPPFCDTQYLVGGPLGRVGQTPKNYNYFHQIYIQ